jgi:hypothetical protein
VTGDRDPSAALRSDDAEHFALDSNPHLSSDAAFHPRQIQRIQRGLSATDLTPTRLRIISGFGNPGDRRTEPRIPSSIPAGINGQRGFDHTALIYNTSRTGALLITSHPCRLDQVLHLSFQIFGDQYGTVVPARVVRVGGRAGDPLWRFDVGVRFEEPLGAELLAEIEKRAEQAG